MNSSNLPEKDGSSIINQVDLFVDDFFKAMDDDFNTPIALSVLFDFVRFLNKELVENSISKSSLSVIHDIFVNIEYIFGLTLFKDNDVDNDLSGSLLSILTDIRSDLRSSKLWDLADKIRDDLSVLGVNLEDK